MAIRTIKAIFLALALGGSIEASAAMAADPITYRIGIAFARHNGGTLSELVCVDDDQTPCRGVVAMDEADPVLATIEFGRNAISVRFELHGSYLMYHDSHLFEVPLSPAGVGERTFTVFKSLPGAPSDSQPSGIQLAVRRGVTPPFDDVGITVKTITP